jgi:hypothetical protein
MFARAVDERILYLEPGSPIPVQGQF